MIYMLICKNTNVNTVLYIKMYRCKGVNIDIDVYITMCGYLETKIQNYRFRRKCVDVDALVKIKIRRC